MFGYITDLRTITSGRATSTMEFFAFENAPKNISEEVIANVKGEK
jgi:elongation factor G